MKNNIKTVKVNTKKQYDVLIGKGLISEVGKIFADRFNACKIAIITDDIVNSLYADGVECSLREYGYKTVKFVFKNGEQSKNLNTYAEILTFLTQNELSRTDMVVALGGGVVGDIAGFSASTYLRGIKYVQIPTTLLSQIDSSVGGKTGIDLKEGKNLVGAFYQPELVLCDTQTLSSLEKPIFDDGLGEGIKYALLDEKVFSLLKELPFDLTEFVKLCVEYKAKIVSADEFEGGNRKLLNLGHTLAHGIEKLSSYAISHGKAVALGIDIVLNASKKHGYITKNEYDEIVSVIGKVVKADLCLIEKYTLGDILSCAIFDKKRSGEDIDIIVVKGVGNCAIQKIKVACIKEFFI